jgi:hypothetical protein
MAISRFYQIGRAVVLLGVLAGCQLSGAKPVIENRGEFLLETKISAKELEFDIYEISEFGFAKIIKKEKDYGSLVSYTLYFADDRGVIDIKKRNGWNYFPDAEAVYAKDEDQFAKLLSNLKYSAPFDQVRQITSTFAKGGGMYTFGTYAGKRCFASRTGYDIRSAGKGYVFQPANGAGTDKFDTIIDVKYCGTQPAEELIGWLQRVRLK